MKGYGKTYFDARYLLHGWMKGKSSMVLYGVTANGVVLLSWNGNGNGEIYGSRILGIAMSSVNGSSIVQLHPNLTTMFSSHRVAKMAPTATETGLCILYPTTTTASPQ